MSPSATMVSRSTEEPASSLTRISKGFEGIAAKFLWTEYWKLVCRTKTRDTIRGTVITGTVTPYGGATRRRRFPRLTADSGEIFSRRLEIRSNDTSVPLESKRFTKGSAPNSRNTRRVPLIVHTATDTASRKLRPQSRFSTTFKQLLGSLRTASVSNVGVSTSSASASATDAERTPR